MDASDASSASRLPTSNQPNMGFAGARQHQSAMEVIDLTDSPPGSPPRLTYRPPPISSHDQRPAKRQRIVAPAPAPVLAPRPVWAPSTPIVAAPRAVPRPPPQVAHPSSRPTPSPLARPAPPPPANHQPPRQLSACLQAQVVPLLRRLLVNTPSIIAGDVTTTVIRNLLAQQSFLAEVKKTGGYMSPAYMQILDAYLAAEITRRIASHLDPVPVPPANPVPLPLPLPPGSTGNPTTVPAPSPATVPPPQLATVPAPRPAPVPTPPLGVFPPPLPAATQQRIPIAKPKSKAAALAKTSSSEFRGLQRPTSRPYLPVSTRKSISCTATTRLLLRTHTALPTQLVYHVDFNRQEIEAVRTAVRRHQGKQGISRKEPLRELGKIIRKSEVAIEALARDICLKDVLKDRDVQSVLAFLQDAVNKVSTDPGRGQTLTLKLKEPDAIKRLPTKKRISSLLLAREIEGGRGFGRMRKHVNFTQEFRKAREDDMDIRAEWTNCAGDIATISWVGNGQHFVCGTTTHSDSHNQQYNKPGNLLFCSPDKGRLQAYPDHRIVRPIIETGENGTDAMRESQEPWLYSSVVSSDYDAVNRLAYTSSFDKTVKVWSIDEEAGTMRATSTWQHEGVVNFVAASKNGSGLIATAADVPNLAVRIYHVDRSGVMTSCQSLSGLRSWNEDDQHTLAPQTWAYFPATMQWGIAKGAQHLLLVGYSPRSLTGDDNDIPVEKRNSGEILLWDCIRNERCKVLTASTQNVFEVAWHPTQPCFVVATSPSGLLVKENVRTQIRLFRPSYSQDLAGAFSEVQCLDCPAIDINELTIVPNSLAFCYVTAAATDGCVYVWDTARGDDPVHHLQHGTPLEGDASEEHYVRERDDTGVKFTAWGTSLDRFYTGGSDGVVKVWNIRSEHRPLVRVILEAPAPISAGSFSPDKTKLAIGDATGRVYLFSVNEMEALANTAVKLPPGFAGNLKSIRRPRPYTRHATPAPPAPPPDSNPEPVTGVALASRYLARSQISINPKRIIGAVQGPRYSTLGLYRDELHLDGQRDGPLLANVEQQQQENMSMFKGITRLPILLKPTYSVDKFVQHRGNLAVDLRLTDLPADTQLELRMAGINLYDPIEEACDEWDLPCEEV